MKTHAQQIVLNVKRIRSIAMVLYADLDIFMRFLTSVCATKNTT